MVYWGSGGTAYAGVLKTSGLKSMWVQIPPALQSYSLVGNLRMSKQRVLNNCTDTSILIRHYGHAVTEHGTKDQREYASVLQESMEKYIRNIKLHINSDCKRTRKQEELLLNLELDALRDLYHTVMSNSRHQIKESKS